MPEQHAGEVTLLLRQWKQGDERALIQLVPLIHRDLQVLAHRQLQRERSDHSLQSAALVNEAFLRLVGAEPFDVRNRDHFIAVAATLMRRILVDYARARGAAKRDAGAKVSLDEAVDSALPDNGDVLAIDEALDVLARVDPRQAKIVELKFFGGLSAAAIAELLDLSPATVDRDWATARIFLYRQLRCVATGATVIELPAAAR
jgi:RNA polymerase sigma factor (TIGR02999 family)